MIIVTGGAGFIGSNILKGLEEKGYKDLVVTDWLGQEDKWKNIAKRELAYIVLPEDLDEFLIKHESEITAVIHMGAISTTTEKDVDLIVRSNQQLTWKLWEFCRDFNKQFIYASSAATYGSGENGFKDEETLEYLKALRPLNPYGWSKAFFDRKVAREIAEGRKTPKQYAGLKFFNVYGPNEYHKGGQKSVVAHIFPDIKADNAVKLFKSYNPKYADGQQMRDFVWVGDIVNVIVWLLEHPEVNGLFNVGAGEARSFYDLAAAAWKAMGKEPKIIFKEMPEELRGKYQYYTKADITKLREAGYKEPMTPLEEGVRLYVQDYLNQEDPYL
ncbi:MAG: ADP-glyceromanno-heptose 6-epimerase [Candidatus Avelusimicrobium sp.]|uniref:ADP-glyceromanno-heptose 6-epimerase n=1 Tax=Candidatus Avelusimicrobium sp. TaxID=3048833 RepID=UPI003F0DEEB9